MTKPNKPKVTLVMVMSIDGKTTKWHDPHISSWTSREDKTQFISLIENSTAIVMGRKTYEAAKEIMKLTPQTFRIVMTSKPDLFKPQRVPRQLEFTNESPKEIAKKLKDHNEVLLLGGGETNTQFLKDGLVDEILLTLEPSIFGEGNSLVSAEKLDLNLELIESQQLNPQGTLLLRYKVNK